MFDNLPQHAHEVLDRQWDYYAPYVQDLLNRPLNASTLAQWLEDWTQLIAMIHEIEARLYVDTTLNTVDEEAEQRLFAFLEHVYPPIKTAEQQLREKLLASGFQPDGMAIAMRDMQADSDLFREANLPLLSDEQKLNNEYDKIRGEQTVEWQGEVYTLDQLRSFYRNNDRTVREGTWRLASERQLADRDTFNNLWTQLLDLRQQLAAHADLSSYRDYIWQVRKRFDYTPDDCLAFHDAIEEVVVPAVARLDARRRQHLGVETLRPWDMMVNVNGHPALRPFETVAELCHKTRTIFTQVDPQLGAYFERMEHEQLLDLDNRKNKAPGGYCITYDYARCPFIMMNAVNVHEDVQTLLHEGGHAFHAFAVCDLPYVPQRNVPLEFCEVASMAMELLSTPYLTTEAGGFYTEAEAARARIEHLEDSLRFWPYMCVVDAFQHWVYTHPDQARDPANCDAHWLMLWRRFMPGENWSGLAQAEMTGWQRKLHIFQVPFYYIEYGIAQLGAMQVWRNAIHDHTQAVVDYRRALALGNTVTLPELFTTAGIKLAFDADTLRSVVDLAEETIGTLEQVSS